MKTRSIILIGFMGSGKSSIGKQLAKHLSSKSTEAANNCVAPVLASSSIDYTLSRCAPSTPCSSQASAILKTDSAHFEYDYLDTDELIVSKKGTSIASIFETVGEAHFREMETETLEELSSSSKKNFVLSTGGGIILSEKNCLLLKSLGTVIWLHASPDVLFERAMRQAKRPLLEVEYPRRTFNELLAKRLPLYREVYDIKIDTTQLSYSQTVEELIKQLLKN